MAQEQLAHKIKPPSQKGVKRDRTQLVALLRTMFDLAQDKSVAPHIRAACARAWSDLSERKRVMDGKPLPGQLRPDLQQRKRPKPIPFAAATRDGPDVA